MDMDGTLWAAIPAIGSAFFGSKVDDVVVQWVHLDGLERPARQAVVGLRPGQAPVSTDIRSPNRRSIDHLGVIGIHLKRQDIDTWQPNPCPGCT